jgi:hypothetical protein
LLCYGTGYPIVRTALECWHKTHRAVPTSSPRPARATGCMASTTVYPCGAGSVCRCGFQTVLWKYAVYRETGPFHPEKAQFPAGESTKPNSVTPSALERRHKKHTYLFRSPHRPNSITPSVLERWHKKHVHLLSGAGGGRRVHGARARRRCVRSCGAGVLTARARGGATARARRGHQSHEVISK